MLKYYKKWKKQGFFKIRLNIKHDSISLMSLSLVKVYRALIAQERILIVRGKKPSEK